MAALAAIAALAAPTASTAAPAHDYGPPFTIGATGGDQWSYHSATADGSVTVGRAYPIPGIINCTKGGPYARLLVKLKSTKPIRKIVLSYDSAAVDNFTFVQLSLRDLRGRFYGTRSLRGFVQGSGTLTLTPDPQRRLRHPLAIEFGLQESSACPNADAGTIHFTDVRVFS